MATLVQTQVLRLAQRVDPYTKAGSEFAAGTVGTTGGSRFTAQRLLDIYNEARMALFRALKTVYQDKEELTRQVGALLTHNTTFTFTLTGSVSVGTKPTGFIEFVSLLNNSNVQIVLLSATFLPEVLKGVNPYYTQSATNMSVFDIGTQFVHYGTFVTTASTYKLAYIGITDFALSDVTGGATNETFNEQFHPLILELGAALGNEQGNVDAVALAQQLLKIQKVA